MGVCIRSYRCSSCKKDIDISEGNRLVLAQVLSPLGPGVYLHFEQSCMKKYEETMKSLNYQMIPHVIEKGSIVEKAFS